MRNQGKCGSRKSHTLRIVIMSPFFEYTNMTNETHGHVFFIWLAALTAEGQKDERGMMSKVWKTHCSQHLRLKGSHFAFTVIPFSFLVSRHTFSKNPRGDWSTKSITKNVTATEGKKADNFCLSNSIKVNAGDCTLKKYPITNSVHFSALWKSPLIYLVDLTVSTVFNLCISAEMIHVTLLNTNRLAGMFALQRCF